MVFLLEHVMLLLDCPVFKSDLFILVQELNQKKKTAWKDGSNVHMCLKKNYPLVISLEGFYWEDLVMVNVFLNKTMLKYNALQKCLYVLNFPYFVMSKP